MNKEGSLHGGCECQRRRLLESNVALHTLSAVSSAAEAILRLGEVNGIDPTERIMPPKRALLK